MEIEILEFLNVEYGMCFKIDGIVWKSVMGVMVVWVLGSCFKIDGIVWKFWYVN